MGTLEQQALKERSIKRMEAMFAPQRDSFYEFLKFYRKNEKKENLDDNWHIRVICDKLEKVYSWDIKRLIINIPPRSLKTEIVSKAFPVWCLWHDPRLKFMAISYSATLAEQNSWWARSMYLSDTFLSVFPRRKGLKPDKNTQQHRETTDDWQYFSSGSQWSITWFGCDIMIIDDPINPQEANSDLILNKVNNNFHETLKSRLNSKTDGAIVVMMQRLHDNDLTWHLLDQKRRGVWEEWEELVIPAIAESDDEYRKAWESFFEKRFPIEWLRSEKAQKPVVFSTQYQQNPVNKDTQEFHEEWFRYYTDDQKPSKLRIFTACDPAFSKKTTADNSCIMTAWFDGMDMYILEYTAWKFNPAELQDKLLYHQTKRNPEKIGVEAFQAQSMIWFNLKAEAENRWINVNIEELRQSWDKETKLRKLIPLYRNWHIYHKLGMEELEFELKRFPRWQHDDIIDAEQMLYSMYEIAPNNRAFKNEISISYDQNWAVIIWWYNDDIY